MKHSPFWHHYENKLHTDILLAHVDGVTLLMTYGPGSFEWERVCIFRLGHCHIKFVIVQSQRGDRQVLSRTACRSLHNYRPVQRS